MVKSLIDTSIDTSGGAQGCCARLPAPAGTNCSQHRQLPAQGTQARIDQVDCTGFTSSIRVLCVRAIRAAACDACSLATRPAVSNLV